MTTRAAPPTLTEIQAPVEARLDATLEQLREAVVTEFTPAAEVNEYLLQARGKLFRPTLLLLANEVGGQPHPDAELLAAVVEMVHLATLVHDDAVDHSVLRRGMPTVNARWTHQVAVIMGDFLYSRSITEMSRLGRLEPIRILAEAANAMTVGEMRQLSSHEALDFDESDYDQLVMAKTASLISAACELGALVGASEYRERLADFGRELGIAFQITDDLLDYVADESETGKPSGLDLREHKVTLPLIATLPALEPGERRQLEQFFRDPEPQDTQIRWIIDLVRVRGGLDYARGRALEHGRRAEEALEGLPASSALEALRDSIGYVLERRR